MRRIVLAALVALTASAANSQQYLDPQAIIDSLLRQQIEQNAQRQQNERMRLELERLDLERQLRYRRLTDSQLMGELTRYCQNGASSCIQPPPNSLLREAASRGLIELRPSQSAPSGQDCMIIGLGDGDGILDCQ